jgi:glycosyltransferase involved in cell wall biosynthesis
MRSEIDVVVPVYNEADGIETNMTLVVNALDAAALTSRTRLILVDDGSTDGTFAAIERFAAKRVDVAMLRFTRNFGKEAAIEAGLAHSEGDAVIVMDSDLQHPPELIARFVKEWRGGALVVEGVKRTRGRESLATRSFARLFYWLFGRLTDLHIDNHTDFKLLDRRIVDLYLRLPERRKFFRGLVRWMGHAAVQVPFDVPERNVGRSGWPRLRLLRYASDSIYSFSGIPLHLLGLLGAIAIAMSLAILGIALVQYVRGTAAAGFTTVIFLLVFVSGFQLMAFAIIGGFIARIYDEIKSRPRFLVAQMRGFGRTRVAPEVHPDAPRVTE